MIADDSDTDIEMALTANSGVDDDQYNFSNRIDDVSHAEGDSSTPENILHNE
jgi:hypothetical protein